MKLKKGIITLLIPALLIVLLVPKTGSFTFAATNEDIQWLIDQSILNDNFNLSSILNNPDKIITRQEYISLFMSYLKQEGTNKQYNSLIFADKGKINKNFRTYIAAANSLGILKTASKNGKLYIKPVKNLTKQMAAYYLGIILGINIDLEPLQYKDYEKIANKIKPYVTGVLCADLMQGVTQDEFKPKELVTWKDAAVIIRNAWEKGYLTVPDCRIEAGEVMKGSVLIRSEFDQPLGIARDARDGTLYVADTNNNQIKTVKSGNVTILAGRESIKDEGGVTVGGYQDGNLDTAIFNQPAQVHLITGGVLILDTGNHSIRFMSSKNNVIETYAGNGTAGSADGAKHTAAFKEPRGFTVTNEGEIYIADTGNHCIRKIDLNGNVTTFAGVSGSEGYKDGSVKEAMFNRPNGIAVYNNTIYVADTGNQRIRKIENGRVTTFAGSGDEMIEGTDDYVGGYQDGDSQKAQFNGPVYITVDNKGILYVSDFVNGMIRVIKDGKVGTIAGLSNLVTNKKGAWESILVSPAGLSLSPQGDYLYLTDSFNNLIIRIKTIQ